MKICESNRLEIEKEFLALLLNKPDLFDIVQVQPEYLIDEKNRKVFKYAKECYEEYGCLSVVKIVAKHLNFDLDYFIQIYNNTLFFQNNWKEQLSLSEESIVKFYKQDIVKKLNDKLEKGKTEYDEFIKQMRRLDDIVLIENSITLSSKELIEGINEDKARLNLNNFETLNRKLQLVQGDFLIIGATTGMGKSGFMLNLMNDLMTGFQCIYFNMEMSKSTIYRRIVSIKANMPINDVVYPKSEHQRELIKKAMNEIEQAGLIVEHKANDIKEIKSIMMKVKDKNRHTILFVDHLGLTKCDNQKSLYEQTTEVAKELRQMCLEYDCTIIGASQLNRTAYGSERPSLSMLKDSGELENSASKVILLYSDDKNKKVDKTEMQVEIVKNRDGMCGVIRMDYDKTKQKFKEVVNYGN